MDALWTVLALAGLVGALGYAAGWLIGAGIARWSGRPERAGRVATITVIVLLAGIGIQQASSIRTVPRSTADARAHDYSLAAMWQGLVLWAFGVNAVGAAVALRRRGRSVEPRPAPAGRHADERT